MNGFAMFLVPGIWEAVVIFCIIRSNVTLDRGWCGVGWDNNVIGTSTHMWCYAAAHIRHATLLYVLSHLHAYVILRYCRFSCTCTHNYVMMMMMMMTMMMLMIKKMTDRQTDRQAGRQADRQTGRQADRMTMMLFCCWWWWSSRWQTWCWWWRWWWWWWWWWRWCCCWCWD